MGVLAILNHTLGSFLSELTLYILFFPQNGVSVIMCERFSPGYSWNCTFRVFKLTNLGEITIMKHCKLINTYDRLIVQNQAIFHTIFKLMTTYHSKFQLNRNRGS